jgi:hypothetical protein
MRSFWSDPYLWVHLAGLAAVPIFLELCMVGFATGVPLLPAWLELLLVGAIGIAPVLWMQWQRPFCIFSLLAVALKPEHLTEDQRRLLTLFGSQRNRILAAIAPIILFVLLNRVYYAAPIAAEVVPFSGGWRLLGLGLAAIGFLGCNLFFQVPIAVAGVMLTSETSFATTVPHPLEQVRQHFTLLGFPLDRLLPPLIPDPTPVTAPAASSLDASQTGTSPSPPQETWDENWLEPTNSPLSRVEAPGAGSARGTDEDPWETEPSVGEIETSQEN